MTALPTITATQLAANRRATCRHKAGGFRAFLRLYFVDETGRPLHISRGQRALVDDIGRVLRRDEKDAIRGLSAMCARGHGKSTLMKAAILYALLVRGFRYAAVLTAGTAYKQFSRDVKALIRGEGPLVRDTEDRALLVKDWDLRPSNRHPDKNERLWNEQDFKLYVGGWDRACVRRVAVRGMAGGNGDVRGLVDGVDRPDLLWVDDPMKDAEAANLDVTTKVKTFVKASFWPCGSPIARHMTTGTPFNDTDLISEMIASPGDWQNLIRWKLPTIHPLSGALFMPHYWTREKLEARKELVGSKAFAEAYLLDPQGGGLRNFEPAWIERWLSQCPERIEVHNNVPEMRCIRVIYTDPSLGRSSKSDYSAITVLDYDLSTKTWYVRHASIERRRPSQIVEDHLALWQAWQPDVHAVEDEGAQELIIPTFQTLATQRGLPAAAVPELQSTGGVNKVVRIKSMGPKVEFGRIRFALARPLGHPEAGLRGDGDHRVLRSQLTAWQGLLTGNEVDDGPDGLEGAIRLSLAGGMMGVT